MAWLYLKSEPRLWTVGFYKPDGKFEPESDHATSELAAKRVNFLNGGRERDCCWIGDKNCPEHGPAYR